MLAFARALLLVEQQAELALSIASQGPALLQSVAVS
jgi:hypothetical protein